MYSTTIEYDSEIIAKIMNSSINKQELNEIIVTDATAGIGGNSIYFSKYFDKVNAVEINKNRSTYLQNNINLLNLNNVTVYNDDCLNSCMTLEQNVIFIDPPWGGPSYKNSNFVDLYINDLIISDVCKKIHDKCQYIFLKVPLNFSFNNFISEVTYKRLNIFKLKKMYLILLKH